VNGAPISTVQDCGTIGDWHEVGLAFCSIGSGDQQNRPLGIGVHVTGGLPIIHEYLAVHAEIPSHVPLQSGIQQGRRGQQESREKDRTYDSKQSLHNTDQQSVYQGDHSGSSYAPGDTSDVGRLVFSPWASPEKST